MPMIRHDSRNKVGISWYDNEAEAVAAAEAQKPLVESQLRHGYDFGYLWPGRDRGFDTKDADGNVTEWAVVTP
jgi:hypothetical protein